MCFRSAYTGDVPLLPLCGWTPLRTLITKCNEKESFRYKAENNQKHRIHVPFIYPPWRTNLLLQMAGCGEQTVNFNKGGGRGMPLNAIYPPC